MAEIPWTVELLPEGKQYPTGIRVIKWVIPTSADTGAPYYCPQFAGKSVQMTAGGAATAAVEGTLVPEGIAPVYTALKTPLAVVLTALTTANGIQQILEDCYAVRVGAVSAGVTVYLFVSTTARR